MMIITSIAGRETAKGNQVTRLGKDIISAFNNLRNDQLLKILEVNDIKDSVFYRNFYNGETSRFRGESFE